MKLPHPAGGFNSMYLQQNKIVWLNKESLWESGGQISLQL